jgi:hypothetical protein
VVTGTNKGEWLKEREREREREHLLHASSNRTLHMPTVLYGCCVEPGACCVYLPYFNAPVVLYLVLNINSALHVNTILTCNTLLPDRACNWLKLIGSREETSRSVQNSATIFRVVLFNSKEQSRAWVADRRSVKEFATVYGTGMCTTVPRKFRHWDLFWTS